MPFHINKQSFHFVFIYILFLAFLIINWGCQCRYTDEINANDQRIVASVNNHDIIVSDFDEVSMPAFINNNSCNKLQMRTNALEDIITKQLLIQEAQKQNLDKQKAFMKEIEKYWGQTLLKLILKKKSDDYVETIIITDDELRNAYNRKKHKILAELVAFNDKSFANQLSLSKNNYDKIKSTLQNKIVLEKTPKWWEYGDLPDHLEDNLYSLNPGEISQPIQCGNNWLVIRVMDIKEIQDMESFENTSVQLREDLLRKEVEQSLDLWIKDLRKNADVKINYNILDDIDLDNNREG